jgi:hypothetical protein
VGSGSREENASRQELEPGVFERANIAFRIEGPAHLAGLFFFAQFLRQGGSPRIHKTKFREPADIWERRPSPFVVGWAMQPREEEFHV